MSLGMFIVGAIIFSVYLYLMIWSIYYNSRKQQEENYPNMDGMGNYNYMTGHYPHNYKKRKKRNIKSKSYGKNSKK